MTADAGPTPDPLDALRAALGAQYQIERLLGQGGMGSVYLARDVTLDRQVAIKVINPEVSGNATLRSRFLLEARTVARLRHPNIVPVYAAGEVDGTLYFVMEYVPGESLRDVLARDGALPPERARQVLVELALALDHAHAQGLVHRDVKPENILLDAESGRAMLTDFGVARAIETDGGMTQAGMVLGSPRYMSPEQASGERAIDGRSDLYSLALVGYELCTGQPVVQSTTVAAILVKHLTETPPPLSSKVTTVPPDLAAAIDRGLVKDPDARWQSGRAFAEALAGGSLTPSGAVTRAVPAPRPSPRRWALAAGAVLVAAAGLWFGLGRRGPAATGFLVAPFEIQSGDPGVAWLREGSVNMLTLVLGQWSDLNVVDYERTLSLLDAEGLGEKPRLSLDDALALARRANAGTVVTGQVQTTTDSLIIIARLFNAGAAQAARQAQVAAERGADPRPLFDELAQRLLEIQSAGRTSTLQLAQATTTSLEAYRAYLDGVRALNAWRLDEADEAFVRAIALDSSFALAYHKRSLGLGWSEAGGAAYQESARRAFALASRLPPRERSLVEGHYHLTMAQVASIATDTATAREGYLASISSYGDLIARGDSLTAEAWYGLADAYFHGRYGITGMPPDSIRRWTTRSLQGFRRTLAIDSSFHLAYSHLVQLYNAAAQGSNVLVDGDTALMYTTEAEALRLGGLPGIERFRERARLDGLEIARAWARADPESVQPILQLAQSYSAAGSLDSALAVVGRALEHPGTAVPTIRLTQLALQVEAGDTAMRGTLATVLERYDADSLRTIGTGNRLRLVGALFNAALMLGRQGDLDQVATLMAETDSVFPFTTTPTRPTLELYREALALALGGEPSPAGRALLLERLRGVSATPGPVGQQLRANLQSVPYLGYLMTRDTAFSGIIREWNAGLQLTELDALAALAAGDTAAAEVLARTFPLPDSLRNPAIRFGVGGMRSVARAEVLAAVGRPADALGTLEATDLRRINATGISEPGYAVWVRGWLARARLYQRLGEPDRAREAYQRFLAYWREADGVAEAERRQAVAELGRLTDTPRP